MPESSLRPPSLLALPSYLAGSVARIGHRHLEEVLEQRGLRLPQYAVLTALSDFGPLAPHEIATRLQGDRSHVSAYIESLVQRGMVSRVQDAADRRRYTIALTAAGAAHVNELAVAATASQRDFLSGLSTAERHTLLALLTKVILTNEAR